MNRRDMLMALGGGGLSAAAGTATAMPDGKPSPKGDATPDLSRFPTLSGKVVQVLGHSHGYITPEAGDPFHLDLRTIPKLTSLAFNPKTRSYIPLPGPVAVDAVRYSPNGGHFESMRLISRSRDPVLADHLVTIDIVPARVWVAVQSRGVLVGVALIETEGEGTFPKRGE
jgi:hypothetical protein